MEISARTLLRIINDILDFSKIEAGRMELESVPFPLAPVLDGVLTLVAPDAQRKALPVLLEVDADVPDAGLGDPLRLSQVLLNLVCNAIKFTEQGEVRIRVSREEDASGRQSVRFSVQDTGPGISAAKLADVFRQFTQADSSVARRHGGTGLGLTISKRLVEMMGGSIEVASQEGRGSCFSFVIPYAPTELGEDDKVAGGQVLPDPVERGSEKDALAGCRVLLAEDNAINQLVMVEILRSFGASVDVAADGLEAMEKARTGDYSLVLMDVQMPGMDGFSATRRIREISGCEELPVIAMIAHAMAGDADKSLAAGMQAHITKPVDPDELLSVLIYWRGRAFS